MPTTARKYADPEGLKEEEKGKGFSPDDRKQGESVTIYPDSYKKKVHNYYNSLGRNEWENLVGMMRNKGMNYSQIRNHFSNLSDAAKSMMEKGIYFDDFNHTRIENGRSFDKVVLEVTATLIPVGRIVKWGGKAAKYIYNAANKPVVKQFFGKTGNFILGASKKYAGEFSKELIKEGIANRFDPGQIDMFDVGIGTFTGKLDLGFGKNLAMEGLQATVDVNTENGLRALGYKKSGINIGADFIWGSTKVGVSQTSAIMNPKGSGVVTNFFEISSGQVLFEARKATGNDKE